MKKIIIILLVLLAGCTPVKNEAAYLTYEDILYGEGENQVLDLYVTNQEDSVPLLLLVHGGAMVSGDKRDEACLRIIDYFKLRGYAVASVNFNQELGTYPQAVIDIKQAAQYLVNHRDAYHIDAANIIFFGESSGAYLAGAAALSGPHAFRQFAGDIDYTFQASAFVDYYGPVSYPYINHKLLKHYLDGVKPKNLTSYLKDTTVRSVWITHGKNDNVVSCLHASHFSREARKYLPYVHYNRDAAYIQRDEAYFTDDYFDQLDLFLKETHVRLSE